MPKVVKTKHGGTKTIYSKAEVDAMRKAERQPWWEKSPLEIMRVVYWQRNQLPPSGKSQRQKAWKDIEAQLMKKRPPPKGYKSRKLDEEVVTKNKLVDFVSSKVEDKEYELDWKPGESRVDLWRGKSFIAAIHTGTGKILIRHVRTPNRKDDRKVKALIKAIKSITKESVTENIPPSTNMTALKNKRAKLKRLETRIRKMADYKDGQPLGSSSEVKMLYREISKLRSEIEELESSKKRENDYYA